MSPASTTRCVSFMLAAGVLVTVAGTRSIAALPLAKVATGCPAGFVTPERLASEQARERRAVINGLRPAAGPEADRTAGGCRARSVPEHTGELLTVQTESGRRARGGQPGVRGGAYAAAVRDRDRMAAGTLPGSAGTWEPVGKGPLIADDPRFGEVNGQGLADLNGRVADFAYDAAGDRLFAAVGEGGVWRSDDRGRNWRSIGDALPTQAVGGIAYAGGTLVIVTGDNVFGGGGTFAGLGAFRSTDGGSSWQHATGVPSGVIAFKVAADPTNSNVFYAATGAGLFRSTDAGATFTNVALPTGTCAGKPPRDGCALANMVTDVVVQGPANGASAGGTPGAVLAAVGWRAGTKTSPYGYVESPSNGVYRSSTGAPGTFTQGGAFAPTSNPGRIELGAATGAQQDHRYVYAMVEDAAQVQRRSAAGRAAGPRDPVPDELRRRLRVLGLRAELDADGVRRAARCRPSLGLGAERHGLRDAVLPGNPVLVQPVDRARSEWDGRPEADRVRARGDLGRDVAHRAFGADALPGRRAVLLRQHVHVPHARPGVPDHGQ